MALDAAGEHEAAERAYRWLAGHQNRGRLLVRGVRRRGRATPSPTAAAETNFCAYIAVGVWHHYLSTGDDAFLDRMWPTVFAAVEFVLAAPAARRADRLEARGRRHGRRRRAADREFVRPPGAALRARHRRAPRGAAARLGVGGRARCGHAIRRHPERFLDKGRYSMDWYYPVLGGALTRRRGQGPYRGGLGPLRRARPRRALRRAQPVGDRRRERPNSPWRSGRWASPTARWRSSSRIQHLRDRGRGLYWTGYVFEDDGDLARGTHHLDGGFPAARGGRARAATRRPARSSAASGCRRDWTRTAAPDRPNQPRLAEKPVCQCRLMRLAIAWPTNR